MSAVIAGLAGLLCGVLSGLGIGGGTLLMVWLTAVMGMAQKSAQGINLLFFLPTAACALVFHIKNRLIRPRIVVPAILAGCVCAAGAAVLATAMDTGLLRRLFGGFLIVVGLTELLGRQRDRKER
ncbi:MAG: TSUP family transporter [Oscillospiraceae bacterium]|nr:TSUP family transporter [Oscillospiraceae bacterium]